MEGEEKKKSNSSTPPNASAIFSYRACGSSDVEVIVSGSVPESFSSPVRVIKKKKKDENHTLFDYIPA